MLAEGHTEEERTAADVAGGAPSLSPACMPAHASHSSQTTYLVVSLPSTQRLPSQARGPLPIPCLPYASLLSRIPCTPALSPITYLYLYRHAMMGWKTVKVCESVMWRLMTWWRVGGHHLGAALAF